ncbi:unnamed protein product [Closterium sp. Naga37s-1]|nr:unnamed protein product [Closterium sp. Naga37s-1]
MHGKATTPFGLLPHIPLLLPAPPPTSPIFLSSPLPPHGAWQGTAQEEAAEEKASPAAAKLGGAPTPPLGGALSLEAALGMGCAGHGVRWAWGALGMGCAGHGVCWAWGVLGMGCAGHGVCWAWGVLGMGCAGHGVCWARGVLVMGCAGHGVCWAWGVLGMRGRMRGRMGGQVRCPAHAPTFSVPFHLHSHPPRLASFQLLPAPLSPPCSALPRLFLVSSRAPCATFLLVHGTPSACGWAYHMHATGTSLMVCVPGAGSRGKSRAILSAGSAGESLKGEGLEDGAAFTPGHGGT